MMFEIFQRNFVKDANLSVGNDGGAIQSSVPKTNQLIQVFGGSSFDQSLYRVIRTSDIGAWNDRIAAAFPDFGGQISCFGFDWLGRVFALDSKRVEDGQAGVLMFEPGTGEALEIPCNIASFHDEELIEYKDAALASDFHRRWLASGGAAPKYDQCIGYKKPLFLGGVDELDNLSVSDIDVYWHLMGELIGKARGLQPGTPINVRVS